MQTEEAKSVTLDVLSNDADLNSDTLNVSGATQPQNGTVNCAGGGECTYKPNIGFNGTDTFTYTASDGNGGNSTATVTVNVQSVEPPDTRIDSGPSGSVSSKSASFTFSSTEAGSRFECRLDGLAYSSCSSPKSYTNLAEGQHVFMIRAVGRSEEPDPTAASRTWTVDSIVPQVSMIAPSDESKSVSASANVEVTFSEALAAGSVNGSTLSLVKQGAATSIPAVVSYDAATRKATLDPSAPLASNTTYTVTVKGGASGVMDLADNPLAADATSNFTTADTEVPNPPTIDLDAASDSGSSRTDDITNDSTPTASGNTEANTTIKLYDGTTLLGTTTTSVGGTWSFTPANPLSEGAHALKATATDAAGNISADSATLTVTVDSTAPGTTINSSPSGTVGANPPEFTFSSADATSTFECRLDGAAYSACSSPKSYSGLSEGSHTFNVSSIDKAGNVDGTPSSRIFTVDATDPAVNAPAETLIVDSQLETSAVPVKLDWSATDSGSGIERYEFQKSTNGGAYTPVSLSSPTETTATLSLEPATSYQFRVRALDGAGNWSAWKAAPGFRIGVSQEDSRRIEYPNPAGTWTTQSLSAAYGGAVKYADSAGAKARVTFTGKEVAWVSRTTPYSGRAEVYLDGVKVDGNPDVSGVQSVDLYSSTAKARQVVFRKANLDPSVSHALEVRVLRTKSAASSDYRVDIDAFLTID